MHDYLLNDLIRTTNRERRQEADRHHLGRAARKAAGPRSTGVGPWLRARLRLGPVAEPVRPAAPRAPQFVVRHRRPESVGSRRLA